MKFKFSFKIHSDLLSNGTRYITDIPGLLAVKVQNNTLGFLFEFKDNPRWVYIHSNKLVTGWNEVSLDGNGTKITLTVNGNVYTLIDEGTAYLAISYTSEYGYYLYTNNVPDLHNADSWSIKTCLTYVPYTYAAQWIIGNNNGYYTGPQLFIHIDGYIGSYMSSDGSNFDLAEGYKSDILLTSGNTYDISLNYNSTEGYYILCKDINASSTLKNVITSTTTPVNCTSETYFLGNIADPNSWNRGTLIFSNTKIIVDDVIWFNGSTAVEVTDYTNYGCTKSTEMVYPDGQYPTIITGSLNNYQSWMYLKDINALKLED